MRNRDPEITTEYFNTEYQGIEYIVTYELACYCIRPGNYSSRAADPDEYYGEYHYELLDITNIEAYDPKTDESWDLDDVPVWIEEQVESIVDSYN